MKGGCWGYAAPYLLFGRSHARAEIEQEYDFIVPEPQSNLSEDCEKEVHTVLRSGAIIAVYDFLLYPALIGLAVLTNSVAYVREKRRLVNIIESGGLEAITEGMDNG